MIWVLSSADKETLGDNEDERGESFQPPQIFVIALFFFLLSP